MVQVNPPAIDPTVMAQFAAFMASQQGPAVAAPVIGPQFVEDVELNAKIAAMNEEMLTGSSARFVLTRGGSTKFATEVGNDLGVDLSEAVLFTPDPVLIEATLGKANYRDFGEITAAERETQEYLTLQLGFWAPGSVLGRPGADGTTIRFDPFRGRSDLAQQSYRFFGSTQGLPPGAPATEKLFELLSELGWVDGDFAAGTIIPDRERDNDNGYVRLHRVVPNTGASTFQAHIGAIFNQNPANITYGVHCDTVTLQAQRNDQNPTGFADPMTAIVDTMKHDLEDSEWCTQNNADRNSVRRQNIGRFASSLTGSRYQNGPQGAPDVESIRQAGRARVPSITIDGVAYNFYEVAS